MCSETTASDIYLSSKSCKVDLLFTGPVRGFPFDNCSLSSSYGVHLVLPDVQGFVLFGSFFKTCTPKPKNLMQLIIQVCAQLNGVLLSEFSQSLSPPIANILHWLWHSDMKTIDALEIV